MSHTRGAKEGRVAKALLRRIVLGKFIINLHACQIQQPASPAWTKGLGFRFRQKAVKIAFSDELRRAKQPFEMISYLL